MTTTKTPKAIKNPARTKTKAPKKKKGIRRRNPRWLRTPTERASEDIAYLRTIVPIMRELGVFVFQDIEIAPSLGRMAPLHKGDAHTLLREAEKRGKNA
jgi:hypothetical protein